ncbi:MAG: peptidylprolyl isomerase [Chloroflexota bacterium]|nr:peptidylprolyl isomerase [Chloroflexota bacterium]
MIHSARGRVAMLVAIAAVTAGCTGGSSTTSFGTGSTAPTTSGSACPTAQPPALPGGETRTVAIETEKGTITLTIQGALSPIAAGNFVALAGCGFYNGVVFHRAATLDDGTPFVIQGGDPTGTGTGGPGYTIQDEPVTATYRRGTVAMARTDAPNSVGSQFFIVLDDRVQRVLAAYNTYQIIGDVSRGMEAVDAIYAAADGQLPSNPVKMTRVTVANP